MLLAGVLTIDTPMPSRYVVFVLPIVLLISVALSRLLYSLSTHLPGRKWRGAAAVLLLYAATNTSSYLRHDTTTIWETSPSGIIASSAARYLLSLPDQHYRVLYLSDDTGNYYEANLVLPFLANRPGTNVPPGTSCESLAALIAPGQVVVIAPVTRHADLLGLQRSLPEAEVQSFTNLVGEQLVSIMCFTAPPSGLAEGLCLAAKASN